MLDQGYDFQGETILLNYYEPLWDELGVMLFDSIHNAHDMHIPLVVENPLDLEVEVLADALLGQLVN